MSGSKIKLDSQLLKRAQQRAQEQGYASVEEYLTHLLEQDLQKLSPVEDQAVKERLRGLGYL